MKKHNIRYRPFIGDGDIIRKGVTLQSHVSCEKGGCQTVMFGGLLIYI